MSFALMQDVLSCFNGVCTAWTAEIFLREKFQPTFTYRSMICNSSSHSSTQRVGMAEVF